MNFIPLVQVILLLMLFYLFIKSLILESLPLLSNARDDYFLNRIREDEIDKCDNEYIIFEIIVRE